MEDEKDKASTRIKALLSKTVENGATEAEAEAALSMAMKLMAKYELNLTEAEMRSQGLVKLNTEVFFFSKFEKNFAFDITYWIERLCEVRSVLWRGKKDGLVSIEWFGLPVDVQYAEYVLLLLAATVRVEANKWWKSPANYRPKTPAAKRAFLKQSFIDGYAARLKTRIRKAIEERKESRTDIQSSAGALVPIETVKSSIIEEAFNKMNPDLKIRDPRKKKEPNAKAYMGGVDAAKNVSWERPLSNERKVEIT